MHESSLLQDLAVVMVVAGLVTVLFHRLKQPVVLGYILAGVIIGPHTPPFPLIKDEHTIQTLSELGVIFLMFALGLEFSFRKLRRVGVSALIAASLEILLMLWVGYEIGVFFGWKTMDSIFLGAILSISSTTIIVKALEEMGLAREKFSELIFGVLIFEDVLGILIIAVLSGVAMTGSLQVGGVLVATGKLSVFLVVALVGGLLVVPKLLGYVARFRRNEMLLITVLGLCFGACAITLRLGYSVALGAFLMGAIIAEARDIGRIEELLEPIRDMFSAVFFVSIGLLINPGMLVEYAVPILAITAAVIAGKVVTCSFGAFVAGQDLRTSLRVGMGLAQIGEFSFIIAALGQTLNVTSSFLYPIAVTVSAITTLATPYLIRSSDVVVRWFNRAAPRNVIGLLEVYTRWVSNVSEAHSRNMGRQLLRRWMVMMVVNLILVAGIFIAGAYLADARPPWVTRFVGRHEEGVRAIIWLAAAIASLPLLIATYRKLQAFSMLVAELRVRRDLSGERRMGVQAIVANAILIAGTLIMGVFVLALSSMILQSGKALLLLLVIVAIITALLWRTFIRIYSKAQLAVQEAFTAEPAEKAAAAALPSLLEEAVLQRVEVTPDSFGSNQLIGELQLRTLTGASIVAIQRDGKRILNPGPNEDLLPGDEVLLIGDPEQLEKAGELLRRAKAREL